MNQRFVFDGPLRFQASKEYQARCRELKAAVKAKHAEEFAKAGLFRRLTLRYRMHREYHRALSEITPSPESLWCGCGLSFDDQAIETQKR